MATDPAAVALVRVGLDLAMVWSLIATQPMLAAHMGAELAACIAFAAALVWMHGSSARPLGAPSVARLARGGVAGFVALPAVCFVSAWVALSVGIDVGLPVQSGSATPVGCVAVLLLGPTLEEWLYRDRLLGVLAARGGRAWAVVASSAAFAVPHLEPRVVVATFLVGLGLGGLWLRSRSLSLCIGVHVGLNLAVQVGGVPPRGGFLPPGWSAVGAGLLIGPALFRADR